MKGSLLLYNLKLNCLIFFCQSKQLTDYMYTDIYCKLSQCIGRTPCSYEHRCCPLCLIAVSLLMLSTMTHRHHHRRRRRRCHYCIVFIGRFRSAQKCADNSVDLSSRRQNPVFSRRQPSAFVSLDRLD